VLHPLASIQVRELALVVNPILMLHSSAHESTEAVIGYSRSECSLTARSTDFCGREIADEAGMFPVV
jgi:hypothetical protein